MQRLALIHQSLTERTRNKRAHATAHGEQAKHHVGVGVFVLPLQLSDNATPACRVCYEQSDQ